VYAETEAKCERVIKDFMISIFTEADPRQPAAKPRLELTAGELVGASAGRIEKQFAGDPDTQIQLLGAVTDIFDAMDDNDRYRPLHARYIELMAARYGADDRRVIDAELPEVDHANNAGDRQSAERWLAQTDASLHRAGLDQSRERAVWWDAKATVLRGRSTDSEERRLALENSVRLFAATAPTDEVYAAALSSLGGIYYHGDRNDKAIEYYRKAVQVLEKRLGPGYGEAGSVYVNMSQAQVESGDFDEAFQSLGRAEDIFAKSYGTTSPKYVLASAVHARLLEHRGYHAEALSKFKPLIASMAPEAKGYSNAWNAQAAGMLREYYGGALVEDGRAREAIDYLKAALRLYASQSAYSAERRSQGLHLDLGEAYRESGRLGEATHELEVLITQMTKSRPPQDPMLLRAHVVLGQVLTAKHERQAADAQFRAVLREDASMRSGNAARAYAGLASLALEHHAVSDALELSAKALAAGAKATTEPDIRLMPDLWRMRAQVQLAAGNAGEARDLAQRALEADRRYRDPSSRAIAADEDILRSAIAAEMS
jgi:tetratricopeptide (TPR) repeat protein